jgi:hypothetical protein
VAAEGLPVFKLVARTGAGHWALSSLLLIAYY